MRSRCLYLPEMISHKWLINYKRHSSDPQWIPFYTSDHAIPPLRNPWRLLLSFPITPSTSTTFTHVGSSPLHPPLSALTFSEFPCAPPCYRNHTRWASAWILGPGSCQEIKGWTMSKQQVQNSTNLEITGFGSSNEIITDVYMTICNVLFWYVCG